MNEEVTYKETLSRLSSLPAIQKWSNKEKKFYSEIGEALLTGQLEYLIAQRNWGFGVIMGASMLDYVGKIRLIWKFSSSIPPEEILEYTFGKTIRRLFESGIIDEPTHERMERIRDTRNRLAHDLPTQRFALSESDADTHYKEIIKESVEVVRELMHVQ